MKLVIIHFSPIELYPPVLNWLNFLAHKAPDGMKVRVISMKPLTGQDPFVPASPAIKISSFGLPAR